MLNENFLRVARRLKQEMVSGCPVCGGTAIHKGEACGCLVRFRRCFSLLEAGVPRAYLNLNYDSLRVCQKAKSVVGAYLAGLDHLPMDALLVIAHRRLVARAAGVWDVEEGNR